MRQIHILGRNCGKTELLRQWAAFFERLDSPTRTLFNVADLPVLGEAAPAGQEAKGEEVTPGAAFSQWFALHDIPSIVSRYSK